VAEERNAAALELRTVLLESELESILGGSEMVCSHRRRWGRAKRDAFARCAPRLYPYWLVYATVAYPGCRPRGVPSVTGPTGCVQSQDERISSRFADGIFYISLIP
jgi:hypothetical protein